jgi:aminoacyl tRNA synthase complex-interacting multifunctional protein 1
VRYFDHIQSLPAVRIAADTLSPSFSFVQFDLDNAPKIVRKEEPPKKKTPKSTVEGSTTPASSAETGDSPSVKKDVPASTAPREAKVQKKEKEKKAKKGGSATDNTEKKTAAESGKKSLMEDAEKPSPSMIDLRVGHIVDGENTCKWIARHLITP